MLAVLMTAYGHGHGTGTDTEEYQAFQLMASMPFPRSDMSASVFNPTQLGVNKHKIYLIAGCMSSQQCGPAPWNPDVLNCACTNVTNHCSFFVPESSTWTTCTEAPTKRLRHMAGEVGTSIYLLGGRALDDSITKDVDMYNINTDEWSTITTWDDAVSDAAAFTHEGKIYIAGGYSEYYSSLETLTVFDPTTNTFTRLASMPTDRGDVHAYPLRGSLYAVVGGFEMSNWCAPVNVVEAYDVSTDSWSTLPYLQSARGDMATGALTIGTSIFVVGGEDKDENCMSVPVSKFERYNESSAAWEYEEDIPADIFRFTGASVGAGGTLESAIYLFGGQGLFDSATQTYPLKASVYKYIPEVESSSSGDSGLDDGAIAGIAIAAIVVSLLIILAAATFLVHRRYSAYYKELESSVSAKSELGSAESDVSIEITSSGGDGEGDGEGDGLGNQV